MRNQPRHLFARGISGAVLAAVLVAVAGCASSDDKVDPNDPFGPDFEAAISESGSDFVKGVLQDHQITPAEFNESQDRFIGCLEDAGFSPVREPAIAGFTSFTTVVLPSDEAESDAARACESQWVGSIASLYSLMNQNPTNENFMDLVAACLVDTGAVPNGLKGSDIDEYFGKIGTKHESGDDGASTAVAGPTDLNATLPGGLTVEDPRFQACMTNPLNPAGNPDR